MRHASPTAGLTGPAALALVTVIATSAPVAAQQFDFPASVRADSGALSRYMPTLAAEVIAAYRETRRGTYLANLFRLQTVAGRYAEATATLASLTTTLGESASQETRAANTLYVTYASAMQHGESSPDDAARRELTRVIAGLDDRGSAMAIRALAANPGALQGALSGVVRRQGDRTSIALADALALVKAYHAREALRALARVAGPIVAEDDRRAIRHRDERGSQDSRGRDRLRDDRASAAGIGAAARAPPTSRSMRTRRQAGRLTPRSGQRLCRCYGLHAREAVQP